VCILFLVCQPIIAGYSPFLVTQRVLQEIAAASINVLSSSEELSAYATLLRNEPFIMPVIKAIVLGWAAGSTPDHQEQ
jgi:hypothetical protein